MFGFDHFLGRFGSLFWTESGPKASADRFSDKKGDSEQTLVITMYLKDFTGSERLKNRLWAGFWGSKTERKTERKKNCKKRLLDRILGRFGEAKTAKNGSKNGSENRAEKRAEKGAIERRAVIPLRRLC